MLTLLWKDQGKLKFAQVEIECTCVNYVCVYKGGPVEIHSSTNWNLMGYSMAVLMAQQHSSAPFIPFCFHSCEENFSAHL